VTTVRPAVIAVDLGGTNMKGAIAAADGTAIVELTKPTVKPDVLGGLLALLRELRQLAELPIAAVGIATPGMLDERRGIVHYAANLGFSEVPLLDIVHSETGLPVAVSQDVRAAALAERTLGAARGLDDFALVPIGTGVAAALVTAGTVITGTLGAAGELGHIPVVPGGEPCACGQIGCLEVYISGGGIARRYAARTGRTLATSEIVSRTPSDPDAAAVWSEGIDVLAQGFTILTLLLDPKTIVLGGGLSHAGDALFAPLRTRMSAALTWRAPVPVIPSALGSTAGRTGAALRAFEVAG
jgi:glucokinase